MVLLTNHKLINVSRNGNDKQKEVPGEYNYRSIPYYMPPIAYQCRNRISWVGTQFPVSQGKDTLYHHLLVLHVFQSTIIQ